MSSLSRWFNPHLLVLAPNDRLESTKQIKAMYFRKEYKYQASLGFIVPLVIAILLGGALMFHLAYETNETLIIEGIAFNLQASKAILVFFGFGAVLFGLAVAYSGYYGWKVGRCVLLESDSITFHKNNFSAEKITKKHSEILSVLQLKNNDNVFVRVNYIDGTKCQLSRALFASRKEYLDFISNLTELIKMSR